MRQRDKNRRKNAVFSFCIGENALLTLQITRILICDLRISFRTLSDEMAGRFCSILPPSWDFSSRACDARAFPGILHFLLSQPSHLASRSHSFQIGIISPTFQKKRRRFLEKRWSFSKKCRRFFHISRTFFLCWSYSFWKTLQIFLFIFGAFFHHFSSVFLEKRDLHPKNPS